MRAIPCRALGRATVAAAACAVVLVGASSAAAQRPEKLGDGVKTGQLSVQMFNYGGYISSGGNTGAANPVTGVSEACLTATTTPCRYERLEGLFAFLPVKGVTSIELFGHAGLPGQHRHRRRVRPPQLPRADGRVRPAWPPAGTAA